MIPVSKPFAPQVEKYCEYLQKIFERRWFSNNGPLVEDLEKRLARFAGVRHAVSVANGTLGLQLCYKALGLTGEIVTSPFSFVATSHSIAWEGLKPVFADIERSSFNISPAEIRKRITKETSAIVPVHVFGRPCNFEAIAETASEFGLSVIYDAAHAFGVRDKNADILGAGDLSVVSFHATKLFHTIEGGAVFTNDDDLASKLKSLRNFGLDELGNVSQIGLNAKMNEFQAAMGLCVLDEIPSIIERRKLLANRYRNNLESCQGLSFQEYPESVDQSYAYFPVVFKDERSVMPFLAACLENDVHPRRYFYPSLNKLETYGPYQACPESEWLSERIVCLPLYPDLKLENVDMISDCLKLSLK